MLQPLYSHSRLFVLVFAVMSLLVLTSVPPHSRAQAAGDVNTVPVVPAVATPSAQARVRAAYGKLPMRFERNQGQLDPRVRFAARGAGYNLWLTESEVVLSLQRDRARAALIRMKLVNTNSAVAMRGEEELEGCTNSFIGKDPRRWQTGVRNYAKVKAEQVYRGIDLIYYGNARDLEYDFNVAAGADPAGIRMRYEGAQAVRVDATGDLVIRTAAGEGRQRRPRAYQQDAGERREVAATYVLRGKDEVRFALGAYDHRKPLVIDPVLSYSTYLGGSGGDQGLALAVDAAGNAYVAGLTFSYDFPTVAPLQSMGDNNGNVFVTKLNPAGSALIFSTYLGGGAYEDVRGIALDPMGYVYLAGQTGSGNFPTVNALQSSLQGPGDGYVTKINPSGTALIYSTYLGGQALDDAQSVAADAAGNCYVTGRTFSADFPVSNALQLVRKGRTDAFVAKINPAGTAFVYSTYLGGIGDELSAVVAADAAGNAYIAGSTLSPDFPTANAFQPAFQGKTAFRTLDGGSNWGAINNGLPVHVGVGAFAIHPKMPSTVYAASDIVYKSTDDGNHWSASGTGLPASFISYALAINPATPSTVLVAMNTGIYRSTDSGGTWNNMLGGPTFSFATDPSNPSIVYCGRRNFIYRSSDAGITWYSIEVRDNDYYPYRPGTIYGLAVDPSSPSTIYVAGDAAPFVYKSTDGGLHWQAKKNGLGSPTIYTLKIDPANPATIYAGTSYGMFKSTNGAESWSRVGGALSPPGHALALDPTSPSTIYAGTAGSGIFKSTDGGDQWVAIRNGLRNSFVNALAVNPSNPSTVYAGTIAAYDGFITKLNAAGLALAYSTYLGGDESDTCGAVAVDVAGNVYVTGSTNSANFPTAHPLRTFSGSYRDVFVSKLSAAGTGLVYSTYLGGNGDDIAGGIAADSAGNAYVIGTTDSTDFPLASPLQSSLNDVYGDAFVTALNPTGTRFIYSTYFGGGMISDYTYGDDVGRAIAVSATGMAYVTGYTYSGNFPTTPGAFQSAPRDIFHSTAFVSKLSAYDSCMQDESNGNLLQFDSRSGAYLFTTCGGLTLSGTATLNQRGCLIALQDASGDRRLLASFDLCARRGSATVQALASGQTFTLTDRNTANNICACSK